MEGFEVARHGNVDPTRWGEKIGRETDVVRLPGELVRVAANLVRLRSYLWRSSLIRYNSISDRPPAVDPDQSGHFSLHTSFSVLWLALLFAGSLQQGVTCRVLDA